MGINKSNQNENNQRLLTKNRRSQPSSFVFSKDFKACKGVGKHSSGRGGGRRLQVSSEAVGMSKLEVG